MLRVFIPFWNAGPYLGRCLSSLLSQNETDWTAHLFDDKSTDLSPAIAARFAAYDPRIRLVVNETKQWQSGNLWQFSRIAEIRNIDVVVQMDGDDWFPDPNVLARVKSAYHGRRDVLMTYGNFVRFQSGQITSLGYCREPEDFGRLRKLPWTTSALKTHRMGVLRLVRRDDFLAPGGGFLPTVADLATGFPMLEMAGPARSVCLREINYVYNMDNPLRTPNVQRKEQEFLSRLVRGRRSYDTLSEAQVKAMLEADEIPLDSILEKNLDGRAR